MSAGLNLGAKKNVQVIQPVVENEICEKKETVVEQAPKKMQLNRVAASATVRPDLFITRTRSDSLSGGEIWYTFTAPFDGKFWFESKRVGDVFDPIAQIYTGKGTNYSTVQIVDGNRDDIDGARDRNFKFSLNMTCGQTYYIQVREWSNRSGSFTMKAYHNHEYTQPAYYTAERHKMFCTCSAYTTEVLNVDDQFSGHGRDMVHCANCDNWIDIPQSGHTHSYNICSYSVANPTYHRMRCSCGYTYMTSHSYDATYTVGDYEVKHCADCNAWVEILRPHTHSYTNSYEYANEGRHRAICSCGQSVMQEHTFTSYAPYGHGHNDMIYCSRCNTNVELGVLSFDSSVNCSLPSGAAKWYMFKPYSNGSYAFKVTSSNNTYIELYLGDYPSSINSSTYTGSNSSAVINKYLTSDQIAFVRVRGANWSATNYSFVVTDPHTHNYTQPVNYNNSQNHKLVCSCGEYITQAHSFNTVQPYTNASHKLVCACGYYKTQQHTFNSFAPYGHGHNDMIHCSGCNANIEVTPMDLGTEYSGEIEYYSCDWYFFECRETGSYVFETLGSTDTYGSLYVGEYPTGTPLTNDDGGEGDNFRIVKELQAGQRAFLNVNGDPDPYRVRVTPLHEHNYTQLVDYDYNQHKVVCECGEYELQPHSYDTYAAYNNVEHKKVCECGRYITEEHIFDFYSPYGHGHNDMIHCSICNETIEITPIENDQYYGSTEFGDADWYLFEAYETGTYVFETISDFDTDVDLYVDGFPLVTPVYPNTWDDAGQGNNFRLTYQLQAGDVIYLRVKGYDFYQVDSYLLTISMA